MSHKIKTIALLLFLLLSANSALATPLKLNYSLFFGYMKTLYKLQYDEVTTAFYLRDKHSGHACLIAKADMVVDEKREAIEFTQAGRLLPFFSDQHRKEGAMIEVELLSGQQDYQCDLQVTLMAKESKLEHLTGAKLALISEQLQGVLNKNAGMIGKYFLPTFMGVRLQLLTPLTKQQQNKLDSNLQWSENGELLLSHAFIETLNAELLVDFKVQRITPWLVK